MSFLQKEIPGPKEALAALRKKRAPKQPKSTKAPNAPRASKSGGRPSRAGGRAVTGLEIEAGYLAAAETAAGGREIRRAAAVQLPPDLVKDGEVLDPAALGLILKDFFDQNGFSNRVRVGLANQRVVMRTVDLPPIEDAKQLESAIQFQAQEHIAMPLDQAVLEHQSLGIVGTADGPRSRVVLVAARREMVMRHVTALRAAGLRPEGLDLSAFALIRALYRAGDSDAATAYVNFGSSTNLAIAAGTQAQFTRVVPAGFDDLVAELADRRALTREHAAGWLTHVGLSAPVEEIEGQPEIVMAAREALEDGISRIAGEVRTSLDFFAGQGGGYVGRVVVTGPGAAIYGFEDRFAADLGIPAEVRAVSEASGAEVVGGPAAQFSVAAGLTVVEVSS